jgi:hypothetical protein
MEIVQPLDPETGLPDLATPVSEAGVQWERILPLGRPDVILAAKTGGKRHGI